jgi:hypothetical protein
MVMAFLNKVLSVKKSLLFSFLILTIGSAALSYYKYESAPTQHNERMSIELTGLWYFVGHVYRGEIIPPFNEKLVLTFQFFEDGTNILKWYRIGENGFCERTANYQYDGHYLSQQVVSVNPNNAFECGQDTDMRVGTKSVSPFYPKDGKMYLELPLGEEILVYIWEKSKDDVEPTPTPTPTPDSTVLPFQLPQVLRN